MSNYAVQEFLIRRCALFSFTPLSLSRSPLLSLSTCVHLRYLLFCARSAKSHNREINRNRNENFCKTILLLLLLLFLQVVAHRRAHTVAHTQNKNQKKIAIDDQFFFLCKFFTSSSCASLCRSPTALYNALGQRFFLCGFNREEAQCFKQMCLAGCFNVNTCCARDAG